MSIMDLFRSAMPAAPTANPVQQPQVPAQPTPPGNIPPQTAQTAAGLATPNAAPNGVVPANADISNPTPSPLDAFNDLWQTPANATPQPNGPLLQADPIKMMEAARKVNFTTQGITQETMQKIQAGGPEAMMAMMEVMNTVAQNSYAQSALAASKIVEGAIGKATTQFDARTADMIKRHTVSDTIRTNNPAFTHPAVAPIISALEQQLVAKFPNATSAELNAMAKQYMEAAGTAFAPVSATQSQQQQKSGNDFDWAGFMGA